MYEDKEDDVKTQARGNHDQRNQVGAFSDGYLPMGGGDRRGGEARRWNIGNRHRQSTGRADRLGSHRLADVRHEGIDAR